MKRSILLICSLMLISLVHLAAAGPGTGIGQYLGGAVNRFHIILNEKRSQGMDVSAAIELDRKSREAMSRGDRDEAVRLLNTAITLLEGLPSKEKVAVEKSVSLPFQYDQALVTAVVPQFSSGAEVESAEKTGKEIFKKSRIRAINGKITVEVGEVPVVVEPLPYEAKGPIDRFLSPFGIHDPGSDPSESIVAVNAFWVRRAGRSGLVWDLIEFRPGEFDWSRMDQSALNATKAGIYSVYTVKPVSKSYGAEIGYLPSNMDAYLRFLKKSVERYDGDGKDDAPGSPIINYWQIENEVDTSLYWKDTPENYARLLMRSYEAIKQVNPNAKVLIAGMSYPDGLENFYVPVFREIDRESVPGKKYFDIMDFHWVRDPVTGSYRKQSSKLGKTFEMKDIVRDMRRELENIGYRDIPIWITEMSDHTGCDANLPCQSEKGQAVSLAKRYTLSLSNGISKIFWVSLTEWKEFDGQKNGYFDNVGLIYNSKVRGKSDRKLAYYTYRLLAEKMDELINVRYLDSVQGVHIYEILRKGKKIYILWIE
jgi:hypothetical protein